MISLLITVPDNSYHVASSSSPPAAYLARFYSNRVLFAGSRDAETHEMMNANDKQSWSIAPQTAMSVETYQNIR
jgi:hypothetical protein